MTTKQLAHVVGVQTHPEHQIREVVCGAEEAPRVMADFRRRGSETVFVMRRFRARW